ncbi:MAG: PKD domain-containing protein [Candidatus Omnitrophota bacterium]
MEIKKPMKKHLIAGCFGFIFYIIIILSFAAVPLVAQQDFTIAASPASRDIAQGDATSYTFTLTGLNGFQGNIDLNVTGLPDGVEWDFNPNPVVIGTPPTSELANRWRSTADGDTGESTLTIVTAADTVPGTYTLTITGTSGELTHATTVTLTIQGSQPPPDFSMAASPASREIIQGESTAYTVSLTGSNDFNASVTLSVSGLPAGAGSSFTVNPVALTPTGETILNLTTTAQTPAGTYTLTLTADGGGKNHSTTVTLKINPKPPDPDFSIAVSPASREITQGESTAYAVSLTGSNDFNASVTLSVSGLPAGAGSSFTVNPVALTTTGETLLNLTTTAQTPAGTYTLTLTADGGGKNHSTTVTVTVHSPTPIPDFSMAASPASREITRGESTAYTVSLTGSNDFNASVTLSVSGLPAGAGSSFTVNPVALTTTGETLLNLTTTAQTPAGTYTLTLTGDGGGKNHSTTVTLTVNSPAPTPDFFLTVSPTKRSILQGSPTAYNIAASALNGFTGTISLQVRGIPQGATAYFNHPTLTPGGQSRLWVTTTSSTPSGTYPLTIDAKSGAKTHSYSVSLEIGCYDFSVSINASADRGPAPFKTRFEPVISTRGDRSIDRYQYQWNFGDDNRSTEPKPEHTFQTSGTYGVSLTVTDVCGNSRKATRTIVVDAFKGTLSKTFSVSEARPGEAVSFTLTAVNRTPYPFTHITIRDTLSPLLQYTGNNAAVPVRVSGQELEWNFPALASGQSLSVKVNVTVSPDAPSGSIANTAYLYQESLGTGNSIASNTASLTIRPITLTLVKQVDKPTAKAGETVEYRLTLKNDSTVLLTGIDLNDTLPDSLEYVSQTSADGFHFSRQGRNLLWEGRLQPQEQVAFTVRARTAPNLLSGTRIENTASVTTAQTGSQTIRSNTVETAITADPIAPTSVHFSKHVDVAQSHVGRIVRFRLRIENTSASNLLNPVIDDQLPQGFTYVPHSTLLNGRPFNDPQGSRRLTWTLPTIGPGETLTLRYHAVIGADAARGRNINRAFLKTKDNSGQEILLDAAVLIGISADSFIFYGSLEGTVYLDRDGDGTYSIVDTPLPNIEVAMSNGDKAITDSEGHYAFEELFSGEYAVSVNRSTLPEKYRSASSIPHLVTLSEGLAEITDFPVRFTQADEDMGQIQGRVFFDKNKNETYDIDDPPVKEFAVSLDNQTAVKGSNGDFLITRIPPGTHTLEITCAGQTVQKELNVKRGPNLIDIPLLYPGVQFIIKGE